MTVCAFYSLVGFSGLIILPCLSIIAPAFVVCGTIAPVLGAVKMADYIFHLGIPYIEGVGIVFSGIVELNPIGEFICSLIVGALIFFAGIGSWKLLVRYCKQVSKTKKSLSI